MNLISQTIISICCLLLVSSCKHIDNNKKLNTSNKVDTLKIGYLDTLLIGKQLYPSKVSKGLLNDKILLLFKSNNYYYAFYNRVNNDSLLSAIYWQKLIPKYIDFSLEDGLLSYSRFNKVNYYDPFLTGFYNSKDSIVTAGFDLGVKDLQNRKKIDVNYLSTSDTLLKVNQNISVGKSLDNILIDLDFPYEFKKEKDFELVLMEATSQVNNVWYNNFPNHYTDYSIAVILSIKDSKISKIQYLNLEYIDYVFKQKRIFTKDIHYQ